MWAEIVRLLRRLPWWQLLPGRPPRPSPLPPVLPPMAEPDAADDDEPDDDVDNVSTMPEPEPIAEPLKPKRTMPWAGGTRGKYDTFTSKAREAIDEAASIILDRFDALNLRGTNRDSSRVSAMLIESLLGNDFYLADPELRDAMQGGGKYSPGHFDWKQDIAELAEMAWPLDIGHVSLYEDDLVILYQATTATPAEVRGRTKLTASKMVELRIGQFGANGSWSVRETVVGLIGKKWVQLDAGMEQRWDNINVGPMSWRTDGNDSRKEWIHDLLCRMVATTLEARYSWHVAFGGRQHGLRLVLPTNPTSALKLFKDRALTEGKGRREALRHWVEHFIRDDEEHGSIYVRDHLRGNTEFVWNEMETELMVSAYDLEKNDAFKNEAQYWRANRKHNRVRVRLKRGKDHEK